ncbi:MAG: hypothetical protein KIS88_05580 [Anaerolineales bacterium]|nr:hypothetical protein [Anaerolineales bacterium]
MTVRKGALVVLLGLALLLAACGGQMEAAIATGIAQTMQISQLETAAAGNSSSNSGGVQATQAPQSDEPALGAAWVSVSTDTHCRSGPSAAYQLITTITTGQQVEVLKTFPNSEYVVVQNPNSSGDCWLWLRYADTSDFSVYDLPTATQPPTPTATLTPTVTPTPTPLPSFGGTWTGRLYTNAINGYTDSITFVISGNSISGTSLWYGSTHTLVGTLSNNGQQANGTWTNTFGLSGNWVAFLLNNNQFNGNVSGQAFCGWRGGANLPSPCNSP